MGVAAASNNSLSPAAVGWKGCGAHSIGCGPWVRKVRTAILRPPLLRQSAVRERPPTSHGVQFGKMGIKRGYNIAWRMYIVVS